jgi:hypothetical protein
VPASVARIHTYAFELWNMAISRMSVTRDETPVSSAGCDVATPGCEIRAATPSAMTSATRTGALEFTTRQCTLPDARRTPWVTPSRTLSPVRPAGPGS